MSKRYPGGILRKTPQTPSQTSAQGVWDMASVTQAVKENTWPIAGVPDPISKSLRFRSSASARLTRTPTVSGNRTTWTMSMWVKLGRTGTAVPGYIFDGGSSTNTLSIINTTGLSFSNYTSGPTYDWELISSSVYRDPAAWYHIVYVCDTTQATASNRVKVFVNNQQITAWSTATYPSQNFQSGWNLNQLLAIGSTTAGSNPFDGYITEINFIDGQALTPSSFGGTNDQTGVWQPIAYTGTYGTNGFYLPFSNTASTTTLGYDFSGNSNNWTTNNISLTSGSTYDSMVDVPTQWIPYNTAGDTGGLWRGNYGTLNPLYKGSLQTISNGNLTSSKSSGTNISDVWGNFGMTSGKWYFECSVAALSATVYIGIGQGGGTGEPTDDLAVSPASYFYGSSDGNKFYGNTGTAYGNTYTAGDVIGCAIDMDNGKIWWSKNGTWQASGDPAAGTNAAFTDLLTRGSNAFLAFSSTNGASNSNTLNWNFGQRPFSYTPPAGFKTLCTTNLSTPTIGATASTVANKYFDVTTYTGTGASTQTVTNSNSMQPDFVWVKDRSQSTRHVLTDSVRGAGLSLYSNTTDSEGTNDSTGYMSAFNSNGFTLNRGSGGLGERVNYNGDAYVGWQWRASNTTAVTNTAGSITSTVSANTTAGFSIVTYTGSGSAATVGHGLGVAPSMIIIKDRDNGTYDWNVYHASLSSPTTLKLYLNTTDAENNGGTNSGTWNSTAPTSTVFSLGTFLNVNKSGDNFVAYCFAQVAGYSAFGSYTGNGSSDGPFIFTGFRPRFVMVKRIDSTGNWYNLDTARNTFNVVNLLLQPNQSSAESTFTFSDYLSNGFKLRDNSADWNASGGTFIYMAFAESPFKYALAR